MNFNVLWCFACSTLECNYTAQCALQYTVLHNPELHCTALHCTALHCTGLHCTALHYTTLHFTALLYHGSLHNCTILHCISLHCTALHCISMQFTVFKFLHYTVHYVSVRWATLLAEFTQSTTNYLSIHHFREWNILSKPW